MITFCCVCFTVLAKAIIDKLKPAPSLVLPTGKRVYNKILVGHSCAKNSIATVVVVGLDSTGSFCSERDRKEVSVGDHEVPTRAVAVKRVLCSGNKIR